MVKDKKCRQVSNIADQFIIPTDSMEPTLIPGDKVIVNKLLFGARIYEDFDFTEGRPLKSYRVKGLRSIEYNDIVIFNFPLNWEKHSIEFKINYVYAKRCVGLPGDTISIRNGFFKNNNHLGELGNIEYQKILSNTPNDLIEAGVLTTIPFDTINYNWTIKEFGPLYIPRKGAVLRLTRGNYRFYESIIEYETGKDMTLDTNGAILLDNTPTDRYTFVGNYYFMCGDNVLNSQDSRYWGFLPEEFIVGVVSRISYSRDRNTKRFKWERFMRNLQKD